MMFSLSSRRAVSKTGFLLLGALASAAVVVFFGARLLDAQILPGNGGVAFPSTRFAQRYAASGTFRQKYRTSGNALVADTSGAHGTVTTVIGSQQGQHFSPDMEISRLGGFASFKLMPDVSNVPTASSSYTFAGNTVTYSTPNVDYVMYDTSTPVAPPAGAKKTASLSYENGYEYEFILKTKPASNVVSASIQTQNLDFYYQPPLNVEMKSPSCTATDCGKFHRPENVVGSYAVYYSGNKRGDYSALGGQNYGTGKAFQIYRPKAIDASGNWTWCDLHVDPAGGQLTVTVPQKFLDTAAYPVTVDPTFGYTTVGGSYNSGSPNTMLGSVFAGAAGTMASITAQVWPDSGYPYQFAIYNSGLGLVGNSAASSGNDSSQAWYTLNVSGTISNANYWLLLNTADTQLYFYYDTGVTNNSLNKAQTYGTWPATFSSPTYGNLKYSIYATYTATAIGVSATLGKSSDGWSGAIPVSLTLTGGLSSSTYPYARAKIVTPSSQTFYATTTWSAAANAYTGTIYPGSNYCAGCADPTTGTFSVTGQISTSSSFSPIAYESSAQTFSTFITRRWNAVSTAQMGSSTQLLESYNSGTGLWTATVSDMTIYSSGTHSNTAVAFPFLPATANITITGVTFNGSAVSPGSAASTTNAWWWDSNQHALYVQAASLGTTDVTVAVTFTSNTDLWATRVDELYTYNIGDRLFYNGLMIGNQYIYTTIFGGGFEGAGEQVELTGHNAANTNDVNLDCMERVAVHVDNTIRADASAYYSADIKWSQNEWANMVTSQNNNQIAVTLDSTGSDWAQQANNGIFARRTQTYYASQRYILNTYQFTNNGAAAHSYPMVWEREQWLGTDRNVNDRGRYAGDIADEAIETSTIVTNLPQTWEVAYDAGIYAAMGVIFHDSESASTTGYLAQHAFLSNASPWAEWPVVITTGLGTENDDTGFSVNLGTVQPGNSVTYNFWQWGGGDFTSVSQIQTAIANDFVSTNPPSTMSQAAYRFFNNTNSTDVGTALAAQNTSVTLGSTGAQFRLRLLNYVTSSALAINRQFKLQYAGMGTGTCASPQGAWTDISTSTPIAFYNNGTPASGAALTANANDPTDGANVIVNETYQETNPFSPSQGVVSVGQDGKWDFSLYDNGSPQGTTYCLRTVWNDNTPFSSYANYPQVTTASSGTVSCSTSPNTTSFGTLALTGVATASSNTTTTMSCTYGAGCTLYVNDAGSGSSPGLWASAISHLIASANSTLVAGTEGYGIQAATSTAGSGATLTLASAYHQTGDTVGGLLLSQTSLASSTASFTGREVVVTHKAAIAGTTPAGSYADTITYSCVGN